jgi:hypothetical protein
MERKGIRTEKGDYNRKVAAMNKEMRQTKARIRKVKTWLFAQPITNPPSFIDAMNNIGNAKNLNSQWRKIANLQIRAKILIFLQQNSITDMEHFVNKVTQMHEELKSVSDNITKTDRRLDVLASHLAHNENLKAHRAVYKKYKSLAPKTDPAALNSINPFTKSKAAKEHDAATKKQDAFYEKHAAEIEAYEAAQDYFKRVLNGRTEIPIRKWQAEQNELTAERYALAENFYLLNCYFACKTD